jgi:chemotaxis protein MotA
MDISTIIGMMAAFGLTVMAIAVGGGLTWFINIPSILIVLGGTIGATLVNYPLKDMLRLMGVAKNAIFHKSHSPQTIMKQLVTLSQITRREGILSLQNQRASLKDPFLRKGIDLAIDGLEPEVISLILKTEIEFIEERHRLGSEMFSTMGSFAPAFGMLGTLIGLVQMLMQMDDPKKIGPAMAVALITTFYGVILANIVFLPIAGKLKTRSQEEILVKQLIAEGIRAIQSGDNPRIVENKLHAFVSPKLRETNFK